MRLLLDTCTFLWLAAADPQISAKALAACRDDGGAALALHSGPSKSADIGQVMVTGVHGPGRVIAVVLDAWPEA